MKIIRNITVVAFAASFMFANVAFHMANNYTTMDAADGATVGTSWGVSYDLNSSTSIGWDQTMGLQMFFAVPNTGATLRLGWSDAITGTTTEGPGDDGILDDDGNAGNGDETADNTFANNDDGFAAETSIGIGYTWWTGGNGIKTSISTNYDYVMSPGALDGGAAAGNLDATQAKNSTNLSVTVGFGF